MGRGRRESERMRQKKEMEAWTHQDLFFLPRKWGVSAPALKERRARARPAEKQST